MTLAIMQPYFIPYLGYFQLINSADIFVLLDDVNYIKKGWINKNQILINGQVSKITMPLIKASQNKLINETEINYTENWQKKMLLTIKSSYKKAPNFNDSFELFEKIILNTTPNLSSFLFYSINEICSYLNITTKIIPSSSIYDKKDLKGEDRIIDICLKNNAKKYINPIGGKELYDFNSFNKKGIKLNFIESQKTTYKQFTNKHTPYLSILDVLMFNNIEDAQKLLFNFTIIDTP